MSRVLILVYLLFSVASYTSPTPLIADDGASKMVTMAPEKFRCLDSAVHEQTVLESRKVRRVRGFADYDGQLLDDVVLFLVPSPGKGMRAFSEKTVKGKFSFRGIPEGRYELRTCLPGWNEILIDLEVIETGDDVDIILPMTLS